MQCLLLTTMIMPGHVGNQYVEWNRVDLVILGDGFQILGRVCRQSRRSCEREAAVQNEHEDEEHIQMVHVHGQ